MSDFFTRLAQRTLGLLPTVKPLIVPMFAQGLLWGRDRAFDTLFYRRSKTTNFSEQPGETQAVTEHSILRIPSLITSEQAFPGMPKVGSLFAEARSTPSQTYPNIAHPASLSSVLPSSTPGEPPYSSDTIQPPTYSSHSVIEQVSDQSVDLTAPNSSGRQPITSTLSGSSPSHSSRSNESSPIGLEISLSQPTIESESRQLKPLSGSDSIRNLDSITQSNFQPDTNPPSTIPSQLFDPPLTNASPLLSIESLIAQPEPIHRQSPIYNVPEGIAGTTPQLSAEGLPNSSELGNLGHASPTRSKVSSINQMIEQSGPVDPSFPLVSQPNQPTSQVDPQLLMINQEITPSAIHPQSPARMASINQPIGQSDLVDSPFSALNQPNKPTSQVDPQLSTINPAIEPSAMDSQFSAIQERGGQPNQTHSELPETSTIQRQIQASQPQPLSRIVIPSSNQLVFSRSPGLPMVRLQPSQAQPPIIPAAEQWEEPLKNNNSIDSQNRLTHRELEAADARVIPATSSSASSNGSSVTKFSDNSENIVRSVEPAPSNNPRFYFRSGLATSVASVAVKPRLELTESPLITAALPGALSDRSEERRSYIRQSLGVEPAPTVQVTIGRVEVRGVTPPAPTLSQALPPQQESRLSLADYLKQREEGHP